MQIEGLKAPEILKPMPPDVSESLPINFFGLRSSGSLRRTCLP